MPSACVNTSNHAVPKPTGRHSAAFLDDYGSLWLRLRRRKNRPQGSLLSAKCQCELLGRQFCPGHRLQQWAAADGVERYEGEWSMGQRHGAGTHVSAHGDVYVGSFHADLKSGTGRLDFVDGSKYDGEFKEGVQCYLDGDWAKAKDLLTKTDNMMKERAPILGGDGPSKTLIRYINEHGPEKPSWWEGFRPLTSK